MPFTLILGLLLPAAAPFATWSALAQAPTLVKDIFPGVSPVATYPDFGPILGASGETVFLGGSGLDGGGLWVVSGPGGPRLLLDMAAISGADVDGTFFLSVVSQEGYSLWTTDGTLAGTSQVMRISPDSTVRAQPRRLTKVGSRLTFVVDKGALGNQLWRSDGTEAGTIVLKDLPPEPTGTFDYGSEFVDVGGTLFFSCGTSPGCGLWKSDGTSAGTVQVSGLVAPSSLGNVNGTLYFAAGDAANGVELWKTDGTPAGTVLVKDIVPGAAGSSPRGIVSFAGGALFTLGSDGSIWKSDGTEAGTVLVSPVQAALPLLPSGGLVFFTSAGTRLYASDGTGAGTVLVRDFGTPFDLQTAATVPGALLFWVDQGVGGLGLWRTDGSSAGTSLVKVVDPGNAAIFPYQSLSASGTAWFTIANEPGGLYRSDGTPAGTVRALDPVFRPNDGLPLWLTDVNGTLFFAATDADHGTELWRSNGTSAGTVLVKDISPGPDSSFPGLLFATPSTLFFRVCTSATGCELYRTDGTEAGTSLVKDILPGPGHGYVGSVLGVLGELFLFGADDGEHGIEPWRSDGTPDGTFLLKDATPGLTSSWTTAVGVLNGVFLFTVPDGTATTLWKTDGTTAGTVPIGPFGTYAGMGVEIGGVLVFPGSDPVHGAELWRTDGTAAGTSLLLDINPSGNSWPSTPVQVGDRFVFWADDGVHGVEPWTTDGTAAGTSLVKDIFPGPSRSLGSGSARCGQALCFFADDGVHGYELWKTDGTAPGTVLVRDIAPGAPGSMFIGRLVAGGHEVFFAASDHVTGRELWRSDGTTAGTTRAIDLVPGIGSGLVPWDLSVNRPVLARSGGRIFFTATDGTTGYELWSLPIATGFHTVAPCRLADTREPDGPSGGPRLTQSAVRAFPVTGRCGIPVTALQVAANVTAVGPSAAGSLSLFAGGPVLTESIELPFAAGKTRAQFNLLGLGSTGSLSVRALVPPGASTDVVVDVTGYFD